MAVPNFLSSDSGPQILHSALRFRSFTPPSASLRMTRTAASMVTRRDSVQDKEEASSMVTRTASSMVTGDPV